MSRRVILAAAAAILCSPAAPGAACAAEKAPVVAGQYVELQPVALPIVVSGQLLNYVYVYVRINLTGGADVSKLRDKEPDFRDALVREGHRTPFVVAGNWEKVDERRLDAAMMRAASAIAGPGAISSVVVTSQSPQKQVMPPKTVQVIPR